MKETMSCPDCGKNTSTVSLGNENPRRICGRFGCSWNGETIKEVTA